MGQRFGHDDVVPVLGGSKLNALPYMFIQLGALACHPQRLKRVLLYR
jgi:hypothetical protein